MEFKAYYFLSEVIKSSNINKEDDLERKLAELCQTINSKYSNNLLMPLQINPDLNQISGAFKNIKNIYNIILLLENELYPQKVRFVLFHGSLNSSTSKKDISKAYGSVIDKSYIMISDLKKTGFIFDLKLTDPLLENAIKWQLNLIFYIKKGWSLNKRQIIKEYGRLNNQQQVSEIIGISQQAVSKNLSNSYFEDIKLIEFDLNENLKQCPILDDIKIDEKNLTLNKWFK